MRLHLVDVDAELVAHWQRVFADAPEVTVQLADILKVARDTLVSPANSHGHMDGGIDAAYCQHFGPRSSVLRTRPSRAAPKE